VGVPRPQTGEDDVEFDRSVLLLLNILFSGQWGWKLIAREWIKFSVFLAVLFSGAKCFGVSRFGLFDAGVILFK
jgi:hypothetical protein